MMNTIPKTKFFILILFFSVAAVAQNKIPEAIQTLRENEQAFSDYCGKVGIQKSFLKYFDENAISFFPHPVNATAFYTLEPADFGYLTWTPKIVEVSKDETLGFTMGPVQYKPHYNSDTVYYSHYFSVWQKKDGVWKVMLDKGIRYKNQYPETEFKYFEQATSANNKTSFSQVKDIDKASTQSYKNYVDNNTMFGRKGHHPFFAKDSIAADLNEINTWHVMDGKIAGTGDFAYVYGYYELNNAANETGYFVRVWVYDKNKWVLRADIHAPYNKQ